MFVIDEENSVVRCCGGRALLMDLMILILSMSSGYDAIWCTNPVQGWAPAPVYSMFPCTASTKYMLSPPAEMSTTEGRESAVLFEVRLLRTILKRRLGWIHRHGRH